jgi:alpha,alpha-trehalose-phosphate synthase [UDP-forming]
VKITLRITISLLFVAGLVALGFSLFQAHSERGHLLDEMEKRAATLGDGLQGSVEQALERGSTRRLKQIAQRFNRRGILDGVAVFDGAGNALEYSPAVSNYVRDARSSVSAAVAENRDVSAFRDIGGRKKYVYVLPLSVEGASIGSLALFYDAPYIDQRVQQILLHNLIRFLILSLLMIFTTILVVRWSVTGPIARIAEWLKDLRTKKVEELPRLPRGDILGPLTDELKILAKNMGMARAVAEEKARLRGKTDAVWTSEKLKEQIRLNLGEKSLFVVSNREPYMHVRKGSGIECIVPAGGLVTALDPVLKACGGVWIANGSGDADRVTSDDKGRLRVPPDEQSYTLRRVWLTKEEEAGYYYGFSNEGLWPLCHITHTRPSFRLDDWREYQKVNEKFAEVLLDEIEGETSPLVLIQDYHFSLLPLLVKRRRPDARVGIFWHIPWPNPEVFGICPWREEILIGLLGADLIGFHTQFFCNNFLETVDRFLESKIDWEHFSAERGGNASYVKPFPISVAFTGGAKDSGGHKHAVKEAIAKEFGFSATYLGIGVDRIDYTKGIIERFKAIERFLEKYPEFVGKFTFVQLGAPSRTLIKRYRDMVSEIDETAEKINWRFRTKDWDPIVLLKEHHGREKIRAFYGAADICMVTSLHDGMNLVAKEFVAARDDGDGVLILSQFAGASRELHDAIIVNPYNIEEMAEAIKEGLAMPNEERAIRMRNMRETVGERNVYYWAGDLIAALARLRVAEKRA